MPTFWEAIPLDRLSKAYADLATYQWDYHHQILPEPHDDKVDIVIYAPDYEINREMSQTPEHQEKLV